MADVGFALGALGVPKCGPLKWEFLIIRGIPLKGSFKGSLKGSIRVL